MRHLRSPVLSLLMFAVPLFACGRDTTNPGIQAGASTTSTSTSGTTSTTTTSGGGEGGESATGQGGQGGAGVGGQGGQGGQGGSGGQGGEQGTGGQGGGDVCDPLPVAEITSVGLSNILLLQGMVVTPDQAFQGEVLVVDDLIACVGATCSADPSAQNATVIDTHGIIMPGMIDTHNHIQFDIFDNDDWSPKKAYDNHNQWTAEDQYTAMVDAKQCLNGEAVCPNDLPKQALGCELVKYGEIKGLIAGTTAIVGAALPANKTCYESVVRTIDQGPNDLASDKVQVATLEPSSSSTLEAVCTNIQSNKTDAYLPHIGEGKPGNASALGEFGKLHDLTSDPTPGVGCLYTDETAIVHGTSFGDTEFMTMAANLMDLVWSPRSNVFLYGAGSDFNQTTDIGTALSYGINVALGCDWSMGGSPNLLEEMRFADTVDEARWQTLSKHDIIDMTTKNAAKVLALDGQLGSLEMGKKADITVIFGDTQNPYDAIFAATPREVRLVLIDGIPRYGDIELISLGPVVPGCETIDICCRSKFMCIAETGNTQGIGQTFVEIQQALTDGLALHDAAGKTYGSPPVHYDFLPLTPIVKCDP